MKKTPVEPDDAISMLKLLSDSLAADWSEIAGGVYKEGPGYC